MTITKKIIENLLIENEDVFYCENEFRQDVYNIMIIQKMIKRFIKTKMINEKLLLNNIVISLNTFGIKRMNYVFKAFLKKEEFEIMKSFLLFLNSFTLFNDKTTSNRIIDDILLDVKKRYSFGG